jgi:hypothetical protein
VKNDKKIQNPTDHKIAVAITLVLGALLCWWIWSAALSGKDDKASSYVPLRTNADVITRSEEIVSGVYDEGTNLTFPDADEYRIDTDGNLYVVSGKFQMPPDTTERGFTIKYCDGKNGSLRTLSVVVSGTEYDSLASNEIEAVCIQE